MIQPCVFDDPRIGKRFSDIGDVPSPRLFLVRAVPICYPAADGRNRLRHRVIIAGVKRAPDRFRAHAVHGLPDIFEIVVRVFFKVEHAPQRLDAHMPANLHHYKITNANEVGQRLPERIRSHAAVYHSAVSVDLSNRQHPRHDTSAHRTAVKTFNPSETMIDQPYSHFVGNLLHTCKICLRRIRIKAGHCRNNEMIVFFQDRRHIIENIPPHAERVEQNKELLIFLPKLMNRHFFSTLA